MTNKQFSSLRTTLIGAAFFIGGAILLRTDDFAIFIMIVGCILLLKDPVIRWWTQVEADYNNAKEKEDKEHDHDAY